MKKPEVKPRMHSWKGMAFHLEFDYVGSQKPKIKDRFFSDFIDEGERLGIFIGGSGDKHCIFFVNRTYGSVTEEQRQSLINWLKNRPDVANIMAEELGDALSGFWDYGDTSYSK